MLSGFHLNQKVDLCFHCLATKSLPCPLAPPGVGAARRVAVSVGLGSVFARKPGNGFELKDEHCQAAVWEDSPEPREAEVIGQGF